MSNKKCFKITACFLLILGLLTSSVSSAWHHHGGHDRYRHQYGFNNYHRPTFPSQGDFFGHGGWSGPEVIINIPAPNYYVPVCHNVEICNPYGACWLERSCN
ncbi:MAG: hypothetical protein H0U70_09135 [Tatlockia sp.]|nr:hypothetical protein [Tatlockia sp.]